jgi:hypothetical protein
MIFAVLFARLSHVARGELERMQFFLGRGFVQTTEKYLAAGNESGTQSTIASAPSPLLGRAGAAQ